MRWFSSSFSKYRSSVLDCLLGLWDLGDGDSLWGAVPGVFGAEMPRNHTSMPRILQMILARRPSVQEAPSYEHFLKVKGCGGEKGGGAELWALELVRPREPLSHPLSQRRRRAGAPSPKPHPFLCSSVPLGQWSSGFRGI